MQSTAFIGKLSPPSAASVYARAQRGVKHRLAERSNTVTGVLIIATAVAGRHFDYPIGVVVWAFQFPFNLT